MTTSQQDAPSRVAQRRAARRAENRADILDAAERVFAEHGVAGGSVRKIGADSGFSAAAIYTFFESKQELLIETLVRRAEELLRGMREVVDSDPDPLTGLHRIVDVTITFFGNHPAFGQLLRGMRGGVHLAGRSRDEPGVDDELALFHEATAMIVNLVRSGQSSGAIRSGDPSALAHLYEVILNEYVSMSDAAGRLTQDELHAFIGGALGARNA